jgi:perosamine synthetase
MGLQVIKKIKKILGKGVHFLHEPSLRGNEWKYVKKTLDDNFVSTAGPFVEKFENKLQKYTKSKYVISTSSGTSALHLSLVVNGVKKDDEVLVPTITFAATANAVMYLGAKPHFVDSEFETLGIDHKKLDLYLKKITKKKGKYFFNKKTNKRLKAIIPVHVFGNICKIDKLIEIAKKYNLSVIEDATEAVGSFYKKKHAGTFGSTGCLSFNGNKILTTGAGGALLTNNKNLAKKIKHLSTTAKIKHKWEFIHDEVGYNYRMPSINAALGLAQLENLKKILISKKKLYLKYCRMFENENDYYLVKNPYKSSSNNWLNTLFLKKPSIKFRNKILKVAHKNKIFLRPVWKPLHTLKHFCKMPKMNLEKSNIIYKSCINLPSSASYLL